MNRAARKYLRQVKKHLCCPHSQKKKFLHQLEDELLLYCDEQGGANYNQLVWQFGLPEDAAENFFAELDVKAVSRFAYTRLRTAYLVLAAVLAAAVSVVAVSTVDYMKTQQLASGAHVAGTFIHPNGRECTTFWVRTQYQGKDVYWEYHSCIGRYMNLTSKPEEANGTEPYATDIYLNHDGTTIHWNYSDDNFYWIRVFD